MNWFLKIKMADGSGGGGGGQVDEGSNSFFGQDDDETSWYDRVEYRETDLEGYRDGVKHLHREESKPIAARPALVKDEVNEITYKGDSVHLPFRDGERLRDRRRGNATEQRFGRVVDISGNAYKIKWDDQEEPESFPLNDTIGLAKVPAKV